jgi:hypothetical protein
MAQHVSIAAGGQSNTGNARQAPNEKIPERKAEAAPVGRNVLRMPVAEKAKQVSKGGVRRRPTK